MILEKALAKIGVEIEGDVLPKSHRTQKDFKRLIAAVRAAEGGVLETLTTSERQCNDALRKNLELKEENERLKAEILRFRLGEISSLTVADRQRVLGPAKNGDAA